MSEVVTFVGHRAGRKRASRQPQEPVVAGSIVRQHRRAGRVTLTRCRRRLAANLVQGPNLTRVDSHVADARARQQSPDGGAAVLLDPRFELRNPHVVTVGPVVAPKVRLGVELVFRKRVQPGNDARFDLVDVLDEVRSGYGRGDLAGRIQADAVAKPRILSKSTFPPGVGCDLGDAANLAVDLPIDRACAVPQRESRGVHVWRYLRGPVRVGGLTGDLVGEGKRPFELGAEQRDCVDGATPAERERPEPWIAAAATRPRPAAGTSSTTRGVASRSQSRCTSD